MIVLLQIKFKFDLGRKTKFLTKTFLEFVISPRFYCFLNMAMSLRQWESDPLFSAAEVVQDSADRSEQKGNE